MSEGGTQAGTSRWRGLGVFLVILGGLFGALRVAHVLLPPSGPALVARVLDLEAEERPGDEIRQARGRRADPEIPDGAVAPSEAGVPIRLPFYRPEPLGPGPIFAAVVDRPVPRFLALWRGERILALEEWEGRGAWGVPADAESWGGAEGASAWRRGRIFCVVAPQDDVMVRLCTDLDELEARRILRSLRPMRDRR